MKKLLCLLIISTFVVGCSSSSQKEEKKEDTKVAETDKSDKTKEDAKEPSNKEVEKQSQEEPKSNEDTSSSTKKENGDSKQARSGSSNANSGSDTGGSSNPPKQETPTPPKEETPTPAPTPPVPVTPTEQRNKADSVMAQINAYRQQNGLAPFIVDNYLINSSTNHAYAMAEKRALWHSGAAECITNYDDPFSAWKNSPAHNDMLLNNNRYGAVSIYFVDGYYYSVFHTSP